MTELSVGYRGCARIAPGAEAARLNALAAELETCGYTHIRERKEQLEFEVPSSAERWILVGGLSRLLGAYNDVVTWTPHFSEHGRG